MSSPEGSTVTFRRVPPDFRRQSIQRFARTLQSEITKGRPFDCLLTTDAELRRLNRTFRRRDEPTDVLSFPALQKGSRERSERPSPGPQPPAPGPHVGPRPPAPGPRLGDLAISLTRARAQARGFGHSPEEEVRLLMLHGVLHLLGMDHDSDSGRMARVEKRWRARLGLPTGLIERVRP